VRTARRPPDRAFDTLATEVHAAFGRSFVPEKSGASPVTSRYDGEERPQAAQAAISLDLCPKRAQPGHHSDIQVTHDCRHEPAEKPTCIAASAAVHSIFRRNKDKRREQAPRRTISGVVELCRVEETNAYDHAKAFGIG
jgi:hypothetical protein